MRLVARERRSKLERPVGELAAKLDTFHKEQSLRLAAAVNRRAAQLGLAQRIEPKAPAASPSQAEAAKIIVKRKRPGTITFDDLPESQRQGYSAAAWWGHPVAALYWCDGQRNLAEVIRLTEHELGPTDFDFVGYFRFLRERGYVEFVN
jgi:hypothetical protein